MRRTEFWRRLDGALGPVYSRSWATDYVMASLGGRTVDQALAAGADTKDVWRAVHEELGLPAASR